MAHNLLSILIIVVAFELIFRNGDNSFLVLILSFAQRMWKPSFALVVTLLNVEAYQNMDLDSIFFLIKRKKTLLI